MIKSAVTIALVPQIKTGPWIFWEDLEEGMKKAQNLGFDGIELFTPSPELMEIEYLHELLEKYSLELAAVGTGAGKVLHGLTLTDPDPSIRQKAKAFIEGMIRFGAAFGAPAIIGSMQGHALPGNSRSQSLNWLKEALKELGALAASLNTFLIYEPLNRYETNLINRLTDGAALLKEGDAKGVKLLADLFHMNIEESDLAESIKENASKIGHIHFADSNRSPIGSGHTDMSPIAKVLKESGYSGFISAEAFPVPNPEEAAKMTIESFTRFFKD
ncbi:sugar phosphate isomerase/epimerase family protein [Algoriphagus sediminis]|uniref:Sugar phosphate isomerase/epimerase family protein n=1 Tax=Algoriphagus sediminis TaxID=3057113 RepID=A0ABT7YD54_9BACT|nr:sugar phosphate isomerase/epimerase family protein [Algoriphagus sediminis]MDN3204300.1 sugar phosphate isomerase/epimerase family protein [Algoriphagus sediminis]